MNIRTMAVRTFIGSCCTLMSSVANLTLLMVLNGEPAWICFITCNAESKFRSCAQPAPSHSRKMENGKKP